MADIYEVELDLELLQRNLRAAGEADTVAEVLGVLQECGFRRQESGLWRCEEISLACLAPGELRGKRRVG